MAVLPAIFLIVLFLALSARRDWREALVASAMGTATLVAVSTEALSAFHAIRPIPVAAVWILGTIAAGVYLALGRSPGSVQPSGVRLPGDADLARLVRAAIGTILAGTFIVAVVSPPSNWDSLTYHLPRVVYWIQNQSVDFYPAHATRQLALAPLAEYLILHIQLLSFGSDRWANLVQWACLGGCAVTTSLIAGRLSSNPNAPRLAALMTVAMPACILQASSTQNDLLCALWVSAFAYYSLRSAKEDGAGSALGIAMSLALAIFTNGTAFFYCAPFGLWWLYRAARRNFRTAALTSAGVPLAVLAINGPYLLRTYRLFGTPLGDPHTTQFVQNAALSPGILFSNVLRNLALHAETPSPWINDSLTSAICAFLRLLGIDPQDPRSTVSIVQFRVGIANWNEGLAGNSVALLLILLSTSLLALRRKNLGYLICAWAGFFLFCLLLRWEPWNGRLHVPFFLLSAPFVAAAFVDFRPRAGVVVAGVLSACAVMPLLFNETRPLVSFEHDTILTTPRRYLYFVQSFDMEQGYSDLVDRLKESGCQTVGVRLRGEVAEYALYALAHMADYQPHWTQLEVHNESAQIVDPAARDVCAVADIEDFDLDGWRPADSRFAQVLAEKPVRLFLPVRAGR